MSEKPGILSYHQRIFEQATIEGARGIILTDEAGMTTDERWQRETPWLIERLVLPPAGLLLDIGCGIGRIAERLVLSADGRRAILGVDTSASMRVMANIEVRDPGHFAAIHPDMLRELVVAGLRAQGAIAIWALQHIHANHLPAMVDLMAEALEPGAPLWTLEHEGKRFVPARDEDEAFLWADDHVDVMALLRQVFVSVSAIDVPTDLCLPGGMLRRWVRKRK